MNTYQIPHTLLISNMVRVTIVLIKNELLYPDCIDRFGDKSKM